MKDIAVSMPLPTKLKPGPLALYVLLWTAVQDQRTVTRKECFAIYKEKVGCGQSECRVYKDGEFSHWGWRDWNDWQWQQNFEVWFVYTLGSLMKRGYLKLVPAVDLSKVDPVQLLDESEAEQQPATTV